VSEVKKLCDVHPDMRRYLEEDCYCPHEIYDLSGFFYQLFYPEAECKVIAQTDDITTVVACGFNDDKDPQCIVFWHDDDSGRIVDAARVDATENNIRIMRDLNLGKKPDGKLDEFEPGSMARSLGQVFKMCDIVIVD